MPFVIHPRIRKGLGRLAAAISSSDNQSLMIQAGGSVTSAPMCVDATMPDVRFVAREIGSGSDLKVAWAPTAPIFAPPGQGLAPGTSVQAQLRFSVPGSGSQAWQIDDILVDPYRSA